jgi:hypothetical protein
MRMKVSVPYGFYVDTSSFSQHFPIFLFHVLTESFVLSKLGSGVGKFFAVSVGLCRTYKEHKNRAWQFHYRTVGRREVGYEIVSYGYVQQISMIT